MVKKVKIYITANCNWIGYIFPLSFILRTNCYKTKGQILSRQSRGTQREILPDNVELDMRRTRIFEPETRTS